MITKGDAPAGVTVSADHNLVVNLKTVLMKCNGGQFCALVFSAVKKQQLL